MAVITESYIITVQVPYVYCVGGFIRSPIWANIVYRKVKHYGKVEDI